MAYPRHHQIHRPTPTWTSALDCGWPTEHAGGIRVAVCVDYPETDRDGDGLFERAVQALERAVDVPSVGLLYGHVPMERDANAAASLFLRERYGHDHIDRLLTANPDDGSLLRRPVSPPDPTTVEDRMRQFILHEGAHGSPRPRSRPATSRPTGSHRGYRRVMSADGGWPQDWEPPDHWESDLLADAPPRGAVSAAMTAGLPLTLLVVIGSAVLSLPWWAVGLCAVVAISFVGLAVSRAGGGGGAMDYWPPGYPEQRVVVSWRAPTYGEHLTAALQRQPRPTVVRTVNPTKGSSEA